MKKTKKLLVFLTLLICLIVGVIGALSVSANSSSETVGMTFANDKYFDQMNNNSPENNITVEAELWIDPSTSDSTVPGVVFGNYVSNSYEALTLIIRAGGYVELHTTKDSYVRFYPSYSSTASDGSKIPIVINKDANGNNYSLDIRDYCAGTSDSPTFCKIAVCVDTSDGTSTLYLNGIKVASARREGWANDTLFAGQYKPFRIGGDYRSGNSVYFKGQVKNVAMYTDIRSESEIAADAAKTTFSVDPNDEKLLFAYDLTDTSISGYLTDLSSKNNDAVNPNVYHGGMTFVKVQDPGRTNGTYPDSTYDIKKKLESIPQTFESWVYIPEYVGTSRVGVIMGNYTSYTKDAHLNFEIYNSCIPRLQWYDDRGSDFTAGQHDIQFKNSAIPYNTWTHLTFVYNNETGVVSCYLNGELSEEKYFYPSILDCVLEPFYVLGGDTRTLNPIYFKGALGDITAYSDVRTAEEIKADYLKGRNMTKAELDTDNVLLYYDIDSTDKGSDITDDSGNGYDATFSDMWITEEEMEEIRALHNFESAYSFAVIGDTQYTTRRFPDLMPTLYNWIAENVDDKDIKYVIGLGDITDANGKGTSTTYDKYTFIEDSTKPGEGYYVIDLENGKSTEWDVAFHAITILDGVVEYSLIRGNHDKMSGGNGFNEYFAGHTAYTDQFIEQGGIYGYTAGEITDVTNTWRTKEINGIKYLFMNLDYGAKDPVLQWANEVVGRPEFADYKVFVSTHGYLYADSTTLDYGDGHCPTIQEADNNNANQIWEEFVSRHANVQMVLCGHIYSNTILYNQVNGVNGNTVTEMLIDPQDFDKKLGGLGVVAMFYFNEDGSKISIEYYSTVRNKYLRNINQFVVDLEAEGTEVEAQTGWLGDQIVPEGSGTKNDPYIISSAGNLFWMSAQIQKAAGPSFDGMYFEQVGDIDLNGLAIQSIGYYFGSESDMAAFGGHYDGNGYAIKNGIIQAYNTQHDFTTEYGHGLFGVIYGAVIENLVLEDVQVVGAGVTGAIVGRAASPLVTDSNFAKFNIISGCEVKDSVEIITRRSTGKFSTYSFDNSYRAGRLGSICGMAFATLIDGCISAASYTFSGDYGLVGGIVGTAGLNSEISNCAYTGNMTLYDTSATQTCCYGGIIGLISPTTSWGTAYIGGISIHDCYNEGTLSFEDGFTIASSRKTHWGGILGAAAWLPFIEADAENDFYPYIIENCYNLATGPKLLVTAGSNSQNIGGIVGKSVPTKQKTSALYLRNCYSVEVGANGDQGTNEYRYQNNTPAKDSIGGVYLNGAHPIENVSTKTIADLDSYVNAVNLVIATIRNSNIEAVWYGGSAAPTEKGNKNDKYFDSASMVYYEYDGIEWKLIGGFGNYLVTKYGVVPGTVVDNAISTPIALFKNGSFIGAYSVFSDGTNEGGAYAQAKMLTDGNNSGEIGSEVQMFFMADASATGAFTNAGQILGTIVIDLNGYTLSQNYTSQSLFATVAKNWKGMDSASINVFGGNIVLKTNLLSFDGYGGTYQSAEGYKTFDISFDDVVFSYAADSSSSAFLGLYGERVTSGKEAAYEVEFTDCDFDFTNNSSISTVFNANDANITACNSIIKVTVNGGEITTTNAGINLYEAHATNGSFVIFGKDDAEKYTKLTVKNSTAVPTASANDGELVFVKVGVTANDVTYALAPKALAEFVPQMSITLDSELVLNVYIPTESIVKFTFNGTYYENLEEIADKKVTVSGKEYYRFAVALGSAEAAKDIKLVANVSANEDVATATFTFSIPKYATKLLVGGNDVEKQLAKDVLAYVKAAYNYFTTLNTAEEIARVNNLVGSIIGDYTSAPVSSGITANAAGVTDVTLNLDAKPTIRFYVTDTSIEFFANGKKLNTVTGTDATNGAYVELDVYAYALCETITYGDGGSYHISDFVSGSVGTSHESLVKAFVKYVESAAAYRESVIGK